MSYDPFAASRSGVSNWGNYIPPPSPPRTAAPAPNYGTPYTGPANPAAPSSSPYGRYTLDMDPEVVAALAFEKQGLADLQNSPYPSMPSTAQYDIQLAHLMQDKPIQLGRLDYALNLNRGNLEHSNEIAKRNILNSLAARNMIRSGEKPYLQGEQSRAYGQAMTDLTTKDTWARQDIDRQIRYQQEAISAAREAANSAYSQAMAARQQGIAISARQLHNATISAYVAAYQRVIEDPALFLGQDATFDPRQWLNQIPTG